MSCKCKNIIENWEGGDVNLLTTFLSTVQFSADTRFDDIMYLNLSPQKFNGVSQINDALTLMTLGSHPSPLIFNDKFRILINSQVNHADTYVIQGTMELDGELMLNP
jgi:hypothetical protein|tara:strand:- start:5450 stop:5770 length:321 start_codon:yes stop_codon:yes gene_type:complete